MIHDPVAERLQPLLSRLDNFERSRPDRRVWDLETARALMRPLADDPGHGVAFQVGGSKGKGTVCSFLAALAQSASRRVGCYLSPHVVTMAERFVVDGAPLPVAAIEGPLRAVLQRAEGMGLRPSYFEALTIAAVEAFAAARTDVAVYEVGLGGRFDATTAIPVAASVLCGVELEHTAVLGSTVAAIAAEKAWIIRPGGIALTAARGDALAVVERHAQEVGARLQVFGTDLHLLDGAWSDEGYRGRLLLPGGVERSVFLPDARSYEPQALALAAGALAAAMPELPLQLDPAPRPWPLPCRFEILRPQDGAPIVLDGAHTEQSLAAVASEFRRRFPGGKATLLFGSASDKRWREGLSALLPLVDSAIVTEPEGTVSEDPQVIAQWFAAQGGKVEVVRPVASALDALLASPLPRLCCGSFYLAGEVRSLLAQRGIR